MSETTNAADLTFLNMSKINGDMRFVGWFNIIYGGLTCVTIIGAIIGVPLIIAGLRLREAADSFDLYSKNNDTASLRLGFERQGKYFFIQKIVVIVGLAVTVCYILLLIIIGSYWDSY